MSINNALIENMIFSPRLLPWSMKTPLYKVSCGKYFTIVVITSGKVFSFGAGESGQLGNGRCTRRDLPTEIIFPDTNVTILDIACGDGHALAIDSNHSMYTWGLNHRGQCGTGDITPRYSPTLISEGFLRVFAEGHSSAAFDSNQALFTWGSTTYGRLLHPHLTKEQTLPVDTVPDTPFVAPVKKSILLALKQPTRVTNPLNNGDDNIQFESFAFGKTRSVALLKTHLTHISPAKGPKRSFSALRIHGGGLWDAPNIIVKFSSHVYSIYNPPRSVLGRLVERGVIICKPPKFAELGLYTVSVSMDGGKVFLPDTFDVQIYKEVSVVHQSPPILDLRRSEIDLLVVKVHGSNVLSNGNKQSENGEKEVEIAVKLTLHKVSGNDNNNASFHNKEVETKEVFCRGVIISESTMASTGRHNENGLEEIAGGSRPMTGASTKSSDHHNESEFIIECRHISLADLALSSSSGLYEMTASVAFNDQDYAGAVHHHHAGKGNVAASVLQVETEHVTLCHSFEVIEATPSCYAISELQNVANILAEIREQLLHPPSADSEGVVMTAEELNPHRFGRKVIVTANSVIPQQRLPKGAHIKAIATRAIITSVANPSEPPQECNIDTLDELLVHCDSSTMLHFTMTSSFLQALNTWIDDMNIDRDVSMITLQWHFFLELAHGHDKLLMSEKALIYTFYPPAAVNVLPLAVRRSPPPASLEAEAVVAEETVITLTAANLRFLPNSAVVRLHLAGVTEAIVLDQKQLMISETIDLLAAPVAPAPAVEGEAELTAPVVASPMYKVEFMLPTYDNLLSRLPVPAAAADGTATIPPAKLDYVHISLSLDGVKVPAEEKWAKVCFFSSLAKFTFQPALPKGGATAGSSIGLLLEEYCPIMPGGVFVRLRGADPNAAAVISGTMTETTTATGALATVINFTMPDAAGITANPPNVHGKEKLYFVDISIDGGLKFDQAAAPQLQIK